MPRRYAQILHSSHNLSTNTDPEGITPAVLQKFSGRSSCFSYDISALRQNPIYTIAFLAHMRSHACIILSRTLWEWGWAARDQQVKKARWMVKHILRWVYGKTDQAWCPVPYALVLQLITWGTNWDIEDLDRWLLDRLVSPRNLPGKCACGRVVTGTCPGDVVECWYCKTKRETAERRRTRHNHGVPLNSTNESSNCQFSFPQTTFVAGV